MTEQQRKTESADAVIGLYDRQADLWDRVRGRSLMERVWLERFLKRMPRSGSILDLGCGSGEPLARYFIERGYRVTGVDSSIRLLEMCRRRFPENEWLVADMRELDLRRRFDGLVAWDSFFHLTPEAQRSMFPLFSRHVVPGGVLMFTSGPGHGEAIGELGGEALYHGSLAPEEYAVLLEQNGFAVTGHVAEDAGCGGHTIWLATRLRETRGD